MLDHWLAPYQTDTSFEPHSWGHNIHFHKGGKHQLAEGQCVLIGVDKISANAVRKELYQMAWPFGDANFTDLGNLRKTSANFVLPLLRELHESRLFPILLGSNPTLASTQFQAFLQLRSQVSLATIDESIPFRLDNRRDTNCYLNPIIHRRRESLFQLSLIGTQTHFTNPALVDWLEEQNFTNLRLGAAREQLAQVEPILRDADLLTFHLSALKQAEAPGQAQPSPSGFFLEEACQLCRYAGMSDKLTSAGFYGFQARHDRRHQTAYANALLVWYFFDGYFARKLDYPASLDGLVEYIVDFKDHDYQATFWKSTRSGRWWMQIPSKSNEIPKRKRRLGK